MAKNWKQQKMTEAEKRKAASDAKKTIARNRRARHDYAIEDTYEAGLSLTGTEVKALRMGRASLTEAWVEIDRGEAWLQHAHIPQYLNGSWTNHAPMRKRKLLLHRAEIDKLARQVQAKGYTIVPLELYFIRGRVKVEIAVARGKQDWDKRQALREAQDKREAERAMRRFNR
ncbi:MAG: SsrA-binding protein SmpB [Actinomycetaceae bacterium]|nr:SsrA-binding protein SmpB [Actinomycetaceae bacterium]